MTEVARERRHRIVSVLPSICAVIVAGMAMLALIGWATNIEALKSLLHPAKVPMNPASAVSFLFCSFALWQIRNPHAITPAAGRCASICAALILVIAIGRLGANLGFWDYRIDTILFVSRLNGNVMAPNTALAFVLFATATLMRDVPKIWRVHPSQFLVFATAIIAMLSLIGYVYNISSFYVVRGAIPMALNTAILFLSLSVGMLCTHPDREPLAITLSNTLGGVVARRLLPAAFIFPLLLCGLILFGWRHEFYEAPFGMTLFVVGVIVIFVALIWWCARVIHRADSDRSIAAAEQKLSEQRYLAIMRQTTDGIFVADLETFRIVECNISLEKLLGYGPGELEGKSVAELVNDTDENIRSRMTYMKETRIPLQGERQYLKKDGTFVDVYAGATVISYGERVISCTVVHDITESNRAHRQLQEKHDQLQSAIEQLQQAQSALVQSEKLASLGQMVAGVAHEINNPLSFVSNNVAVLQRDTRQIAKLISLYQRADADIEKFDAPLLAEIKTLAERMDLAYTQSNTESLLQRSRDGLMRIQQIVKDLRDFARLDESELQDADLNTGIESTINIIAGRAKKKHVQLQTELRPLPPVSCFPAKINQVVMNLAANAIDACPEGGKVVVESFKDDRGVHVRVTDNGPGVPASIRDRIFDPFFTTKPQGEGTGLGLSISYGIIHDHGGRIDLTDAPGGGAVFTITLPLIAPKRKKISGSNPDQAGL